MNYSKFCQRQKKSRRRLQEFLSTVSPIFVTEQDTYSRVTVPCPAGKAKKSHSGCVLKPNDLGLLVFLFFQSHQSAIMPDITFHRLFVRQPVTYSIEKVLFLAFQGTFADSLAKGKQEACCCLLVGRGEGDLRGAPSKIIFHVGRCEINNRADTFRFPRSTAHAIISFARFERKAQSPRGCCAPRLRPQKRADDVV